MIEKPTSATQCCWLFAAACVFDETFVDGNTSVSSHELKVLHSAIKNQMYPPSGIVEKIFTRPFRTVRERGWPFDITHMLRYWTQLHRDSKVEQTPVDYNMVANTSATESCIVYDNRAKEFEKHNIHGYALQRGDFVYTHGEIIAIPISWCNL